MTVSVSSTTARAGAGVGAGAGTAGQQVSWGPLVVLVLATLTAVALTRLAERVRVRQPHLWWLLIGAPVALFRVGWTWRMLCEGAELVMPTRRSGRYGVVGRRSRGGGVIVRGQPVRVLAPRRVGLHVTRTGLVVTVRMLPSQVPADYEKATEAIAHAWRVHQVTVTCARPGRVRLIATGYDPLRHPAPGPGRRPWCAPDGYRPGAGLSTVRLPQQRHPAVGPLVPANATGVKGAPVAMAPPERELGLLVPRMLAVRVGVREDGDPWVVDFTRRPHHLVTGATRSGKSTVTVALVAALAPRPVALVGIDAKGGVELGPLAARLSALATTRGEAAAVLEGLIDEVLDRMTACRAAGVRSVWDLPLKERVPPVLVVVDEVAELFLHADKTGKDEAARCVNALVRIAQLGAAAGMHLWVAGQRFGSDLGPGATLLRAQLAGRICHRVTDPETAAMTLAGLPPAALEAALHIPADLPGVAVVGDDCGTWTRTRSDLVTLDQAADVTRRHAHRRINLPTLTGRGEVIG